MRIEMTMNFEGDLKLPFQYNNIIQAIILKCLGDENYQKFIHGTGYFNEKRNYKMFSFSRLEGQYERDYNDKKIIFKDKIKLNICSAEDKFMQYIVNNIICADNINIYGKGINIEEIKCSNKKLGTDVTIITKSPVVTYSTFEIDEKKKTYYYSPYEKDFSEKLKDNLIRKFKALYDKEPISNDLSIECKELNRLKESVVVYKGTVIKGWNGVFHMQGSDELINLAYNSGLGSKNSQGFGFIETID